VYVCKLKLGISKGYTLGSNTEYDSRLVGDSTDRHLAENSHLSLGLHTARTSTCKL